jgi:protein ImuB
MERYACLLIPDLALGAALRTEPELRGKPVGITEGDAIVAGWMRGLTLEQARAVRPDLVTRPLSSEGVQATGEALCDAALSVGPRIMAVPPGRAFLDLQGLEALFPREAGLLTALGSRLDELGLCTARLGIGPTRTVAELAARHRQGGAIVAAHALQEFLAPLPLDLLEPSDALADRLGRWGVRTLGQLAALPRAALGTRLGEEGVALARRARGEDLAPFQPLRPALRFEEPIQLEYAVESLEALAFVLRGALDRLTRRLRLRGLAARRLWIELGLSGGSARAREVELAAPTLEVSVLTSLARLCIERDPPPEAVDRLRVIATPDGVETAQLDLFLPPLPAPAELALTVARVEALVGSGGVGAPAVRDSHLPDAPGTQLFHFAALQRSGSTRPVAPASAPGAAGRRAGEPAPERARATGPAPGLAQRALRPPRPVRVRGHQSPEHVAPLEPGRAGFAGGRVLSRAGPWRLFGEWWGETRFARDYYDVELSDGGVYRLYHNLEDGSWFVDGIYD